MNLPEEIRAAWLRDGFLLIGQRPIARPRAGTTALQTSTGPAGPYRRWRQSPRKTRIFWMARVAGVDRMLRDWAELSSGDPSVAHVDAAVTALPPELRATVVEVYLGGGSSADHCRRLGCPESTLVRRIGRAHLLLADTLASQKDRRANAAASSDAARAESEARALPRRNG